MEVWERWIGVTQLGFGHIVAEMSGESKAKIKCLIAACDRGWRFFTVQWLSMRLNMGQ